MWRAQSILVLAFVLMGACRSSPPPVESACTSDDQCGASNLGESCCDVCSPIAGTKKWVAARADHCKGKAGGPPRCPSLDCPRVTDMPKCIAGKCAMAAAPIPPG